MQVAEILSDLTSLRVCGHSQAHSLVNVHRNLSDSSAPATNDPNAGEGGHVKETQSPDLKRATELVELHYDVKAKHFEGENWVVEKDLQRARTDVNRVLRDLEGK
ncbi:hypothetical protein FQN54_003472 [Arachnomyces sp. PD_36]|nr:hypothetical protein FQN54_003472 [Arachnomyces sp. PD_36]